MSVVRDRITAIVPAAGGGLRLGLGAKGKLELQGRWLTEWVVEAAAAAVAQVVVAMPVDDDRAEWQRRMPVAELVYGGDTRFASIANALAVAKGDWIVIADAARPFTSTALIQQGIDYALKSPCGVSSASSKLSIPNGIADQGVVRSLSFHASGVTIETPITLRRDILQHALENASGEPHLSQLLVSLGYAIQVLDSPRHNFKITHHEDWIMANAIAGHFLSVAPG